MKQLITTDVLIVGGGGAGLRAAIAAADAGVDVLLVSKKPIGVAGATAYPIAEMAGYNAGNIHIPGDIKKHFDDIIEAGQGMVDPKLAAIVAANAPKTIEQLEQWGVSFEREDDGYYVFKSCFSNYPRTHVIKGHGEPVIKALQKQIVSKEDRVHVIDDIVITSLKRDETAVIGAYGVKRGELVEINAGAIVLATGGNGQGFEKNLNPEDITGDGYAMAYEVGAQLINMEFMQIGMGFSYPIVNIFNGYIWEGKPKLRDKFGQDIFAGVLPKGLTVEDVMHEHRKHFPFSTSDCSQYLEMAVQRAINAGRGTENGGIRIDLRCMTDEYVASLPDDCGIHHMWGIAKEYMNKKGINLLKEEAEVSVFAHAINGGIYIDENAMSSINGLFAAGECAGGPHGADRLGGNMMVTCQVFGEIAGRKAAEYAIKKGKKPGHAKDAGSFGIDILWKAIDAGRIRNEIKICAQKNLLVDRTEKGLTELIQTTERLMLEIYEAPKTKMLCAENASLYHMLMTLKLMGESALRRKESRGSHQRADYPVKDENWNHPIILVK